MVGREVIEYSIVISLMAHIQFAFAVEGEYRDDGHVVMGWLCWY